MHTFRPLPLVTLALLGLVSACATNPVTGKREIVLVSEAEEIQLGKDNAEQVNRSLGIYGDPDLASHVSETGLSLARRSERPHLPWQFHVLDSPVVNAFALPGGPVYLTRGILAHMNSEAAMVGVLGHEIGHITARHSVQQISRAQLTGLGLGLGTVFLPEVRPFGDLLESGVGLLFLKFGRDDERQADELGVKYSLAAGYDPREMASFFRVLARLGESSGRAVPSWLSTHPDPLDREERILQQVAARAPRDVDLVVGENEFKRRLVGLVYGENPREGFMDGSRFKHPDLRFQIDFPRDWNVQNSRQAVYAAPPDGGAAIQLTASRVPSGTRPESHARRFFEDHRLESGTGEGVQIGGFPAYRAPFRVRAQAGVLLGEAGFVIDGEMAYEILGFTRERLYRRYRSIFVEAQRSFARLVEGAALDVQPLRIALYRVPGTLTAKEALTRSGVEQHLLSELALVNNLRLNDRVEAGRLLKTVERASGQRRARRRQRRDRP